MLSCTGKEPGAYEGYEVKLFDQVAAELGWTKADYQWACDSGDSFMEQKANGSCDIAVGIMSWDQDLKEGYSYSDSVSEAPPPDAGWLAGRAGRRRARCASPRAPPFCSPSSNPPRRSPLQIWRGGLQIGVLTTSTVPGLFTFMSVFTWEVWLAIVLTAIFIAMVVWTVDACLVGPPHLDTEHGGPRNYSTYMWEALGRPMQTRDIVAKSFAGNLILLIFSFSMLVMVRRRGRRHAL